MLTAEVMDRYIAENPDVRQTPTTQHVDENGGSYDHEKLEAVLRLWQERNEGFEWIEANTSKGPGFRISCPGLTGWADGAVHTEPSAPLNGSAVVWVENGFARFTCKHHTCSEGAAAGKRTWKHLAEHLGRSAQREVLTGSPLLSSGPVLALPVRPNVPVLGETPWDQLPRQMADSGDNSSSAGSSSCRMECSLPPGGPTGSQATQVALSSPSVAATSRIQKFTDLGNAERFHVACSDRFRHTPDQGWFAWDGARWAPEGIKAVMLAAATVARGIQGEVDLVKDTGDPAKDKENAGLRLAIKKWGNASESRGRIEAMVAGAAYLGDIAAKAADFDKDDYLLNVQNGTLDLRSGQLLPHTRGHLLTAVAPVPYLDDAECPVWMGFLQRVMQENEEMICFLQRAVGYTLTGNTEEQCFFINFGNGANGKSTFMETIKWLMGDYGSTTPMHTFRESKNEGVRNDLAALRHSRLVLASEAEKTTRLNESLVKSITGGEAVAARFLFKELFTFIPKFKIWMGTNHRPLIGGTDDGIWRRVKLIKWGVKIPQAEWDLQLKDKLRAEGPGILRWAVAGWREYQKGGLAVPAEVNAATEEYREQEDFLGKWMAEECEIGDNFQAPSSEFFSAYGQAAANAKERGVLSAKLFKNELERRGYLAKHTKNGNVYLGIKLLSGKAFS